MTHYDFTALDFKLNPDDVTILCTEGSTTVKLPIKYRKALKLVSSKFIRTNRWLEDRIFDTLASFFEKDLLYLPILITNELTADQNYEWKIDRVALGNSRIPVFEYALMLIGFREIPDEEDDEERIEFLEWLSDTSGDLQEKLPYWNDADILADQIMEFFVDWTQEQVYPKIEIALDEYGIEKRFDGMLRVVIQFESKDWFF